MDDANSNDFKQGQDDNSSNFEHQFPYMEFSKHFRLFV
jgi:hypothetical protein